MTRCAHDMPFGAAPLPQGGVRFRLWAPDAGRVDLVLEGAAAGRTVATMPARGEGWFEAVIAAARPGDRYLYRIDDAIDVPDPAARAAPDGVEGMCEVVDPLAHEWSDRDWRGRRWSEAVIYELHVGAFTPAGTFRAAAQRMPELAADGFTAVELMPVAAFPGRRGWGYDGVLPFAPHAPYGRPAELKTLVETAHAAGLMVLIDVVYNHFGPLGNHLGRYASPFFTSSHATPWGQAIDFGHPVVRAFFLHNARYWLDEFRIDGLRVDAVHAMRDSGPRHIAEDLADTVRQRGALEFRHCVLENVDNRAHFLRTSSPPRTDSGLAQWNDDFHHALHVLLTGERDGYYADFAAQPLAQLGRVLAEGFAFQGDFSGCAGHERGEPSTGLEPSAFVAFLQTHDQVGNRAFGERLSRLTGPAPLRAALATLLLAPQIPLLFMGEEYAAPQPFLYFCDYSGPIAAAIVSGRRREFARFDAFASEQARARIPDPCAESTFLASRLHWPDRDRKGHVGVLSLVRGLLALRATEIAPLIPRILPASAQSRVHGASVLRVVWSLDTPAQLHLVANYGSEAAADPGSHGRLLFGTHSREPRSPRLDAWEVRWTLSTP